MPEKPYLKRLTNLKCNFKNDVIIVKLISRSGREIISYKYLPRMEGAEKQCTTEEVSKDLNTSEAFYLTGIYFEKLGEELEARKSYIKALDKDSDFSPAHVALGISYYKSGLLKKR